MLKYIAAALVLIATPTAAFAQSNDAFIGPRVEATVGVDDVTKARDTSDLNYGAAIGYDIGVGNRVTVGVEATADDVFDRDRVIGAGARLGLAVTDNVLAYGTVGYANVRTIDFTNRARALDGLRVGGGVEAKVAGPLYAKAEYRYTDIDRNVGRHQGLVGVGLRF